MIDIHSHIIPAIDDGADSLDTALEMAKQAVDVGVEHLVCTPHINRFFANDKGAIEDGFQVLKKEVKKSGLPLSLSFAAEVRVSEFIPQQIRANELPFLGEVNGKKILLLEMPHSHVPMGLEYLLRWLQTHQIQPVIPHPERNRDIWKYPQKIQWLRNHGCLIQVTAGAFLGRFGQYSQTRALEMLDKKQIDVVASDTHDPVRRPNEMGDAYRFVASRLSADVAERLFTLNPARLINL